MSQRFLDLKDLIADRTDFVRRSHGNSFFVLLLAFFVFFAANMLGHFYLPSNKDNIFVALSSLFFCILVLFLYRFINRDKDIILTTEFQNALFAGAARVDCEFCLIINHLGKIIYSDPGFGKKYEGMLKKGRISEIEDVFKVGEFEKAAIDRIKAAISECRSENIDFIIKNPDKKTRLLTLAIDPIGVFSQDEDQSQLSLAIDPLPRPSGFFLIKAYKSARVKKEAQNLSEFKIGFFITNKENEFIFVNEVFAQMLGFEGQEMLKDKGNFKDVVLSTRDAEKLCSRRSGWRKEVGLKDREGKCVYSFISQKMIRDKKGKIVEKRGVVIKMPSAVRGKTEDIYEHGSAKLLENSPIATAILDKTGRVLSGNDIFNSMVGKSKTDKNGYNILSVIHSQKEGELEKIFADVENIDPTEPVDVKMFVDQSLSASVYFGPIKNRFGECEGIIIHLIDTTEVKNLELRFVHSQKMQAVGQLAGGIAHDFNNLLTAMVGFCDLLLMRHPAGDQSFADIMQIKQNANRAANLIRQLLAFSRKQTLQPAIFYITDLLADLNNLVGRLIGEDIELNIIHGRDLGFIKVDQGQFEQVVVNLAVNARDSMSNGGKLTVRTSAVHVDAKYKLDSSLIAPAADNVIEPGNYILIEIIDTGEGMDKEIMSKIFEPFFTTKEIGSGTGLGLSTVYGIIKQTGGYIYVSSKKGKGTKFSIFLKECSSDEVDKKVEYLKLEEKRKSETADLTGAGTILLVEDETPVRIFSASALSGKGYNVLEADSADAAIKMVDDYQGKIDVIISDVIMPGMNGPAMMEKILEKYPNIKVIFISGYAEDALATYGSNKKFNFLSKPYTLKQLASKVKEVALGKGSI